MLPIRNDVVSLLGGFTVAMALTGAAGLATRAIQQRKEVARQAGNQIQRLAFSGLSAELTSVERMGSTGYRGTIAVENLDALQSLYLLPLDVQIYVQQRTDGILLRPPGVTPAVEWCSCVNLKSC